MLKKFISSLAVGALLISTMAMSVFAASPSTSVSPEAVDAKKNAEASYGTHDGYYLEKDGEEMKEAVVISEVSDAVAEEAVKAADDLYPGFKVYAVFDVNVTASKGSSMLIKLVVSGLTAAHNAQIIHKNGGAWERIDVKDRGNGYITGLFHSLSPVAIVVPENPSSVKTGETLPVMPVVGLVCLAGIAFCVSKIKFAR